MPSRASDLTGGQFSEQQIRSLVEAQARTNLWEGAIRSGKTIASIIAWSNHLKLTRRAEGEAFVVGRTRDTIARNLFGPMKTVPLLRALLPNTSYTAGAATARVLGQEVHVIGANDKQAEEKIRGLTGRSCYLDEITVLPAPVFRQSLGRLSVRQARLFGTTNPGNPQHWLKTEYLDRARDLDLATWHFRIDDNPHLDPDYVRSIKQEYVGLWYRRMIDGAWVMAEGAVYDRWDPDLHVVKQLPPIDRVLAAGVDYGTTNAFAALMLCLTRDGRLCFTREYRHDSRKAHKQLTDAEYSTALSNWIAAGPDLGEPGPPRFVCVDPSAESFQVQAHRDGIRGITDADNAVVDGIRLVSSLIALGRLVVHESCEGWINEVAGYSWDDKAAEKGDDKPIKVGDHSLDAGRYAIKTTQSVWQRHVPLTPWQPAAA